MCVQAINREPAANVAAARAGHSLRDCVSAFLVLCCMLIDVMCSGVGLFLHPILPLTASTLFFRALASGSRCVLLVAHGCSLGSAVLAGFVIGSCLVLVRCHLILSH